ncbi:hemerythrin domain-containing protein [Glaciecola siphonariae]|uniref:Hemerythrin domain-containing protein n=1 Tax=Glaciecola siphonariae TaxID=521012 RepID=A0ABV9LXR1_9ALTE
MQIFEALRQDHDKQRALMRVLVDTSGESSVREEFYTQLKTELKKHATAEERYFYAPLMHSDATVQMSRHGVAEHHQLDELLSKLDNTDYSSSAWLTLMKQLQHKVLHHLEEEETEFFQQAGKVLSMSEKEQLADDYLKEMDESS